MNDILFKCRDCGGVMTPAEDKDGLCPSCFDDNLRNEDAKMAKKRCPLLFKKDNTVEVCGEEKCAWWIVSCGICAITQIGISVSKDDV